MISLSGLSATYPGYAAQEDQTAKTQVNQTKARDAAIKLLGANVAGAALAAGPQAPAPGQASVPNTPPAPPTAIPGAPPVGGPSPMPAPQPAAPVAPAPAAPGGKLGLADATRRILASAPGVANHPEILLSALTHFNDLGLLDPDAGDKITEANKLHSVARVGAAKGHLQAVQQAPPMDDNTPAGVAPAPGPTATDPKTGAKVQWDGKAWQH